MDLEVMKRKYAYTLARVGLNVQKGQPVLVEEKIRLQKGVRMAQAENGITDRFITCIIKIDAEQTDQCTGLIL